MSWVPLHVHSHYSTLSALGQPEALVKKAHSFNLSALALTDKGNLFGALEFYKACRAKKIKPIIGCDIYLAPFSCLEKSRQPGFRHTYSLILLAKNQQGYHNLCKLTSLGYMKGFYYFPRIDKELLTQYSKGLICISGGLNSMIAHHVFKWFR